MGSETQLLERLEQVEAGILTLDGTKLRLPISPSLLDPFDGNIWFIATQGLSIVTALAVAPHHAQFVIADGKTGLYATLDGLVTLVDDPETLNELWSPVKAAWLSEQSPSAPLRLLRFTPNSGMAWYSTAQGLRFLYDVAELDSPEKLPTPEWARTLSISSIG